MDKPTIIIPTLFLAVLLTSCWGQGEPKNNNQKSVDDFYTVTGGWDWIRVPLLKPYEAKKIDPEIETNGWGVKFYTSLGTFNVRRIDVQDSIIYILSGQINTTDDSSINTLVNNTNVPTAWYAIDTRKGTEKGFASEAEFNSYISENKYPVPEWHDIDSLSKALGNGGKVPWIPK